MLIAFGEVLAQAAVPPDGNQASAASVAIPATASRTSQRRRP
jgi:hypothetical protein